MSNPNFMLKTNNNCKVNIKLSAYKQLNSLNINREPEFLKEMRELTRIEYDDKYLSIRHICQLMSDKYGLGRDKFIHICNKHKLEANKNYYISNNEYEIKTKTFVCQQCGKRKTINNFKKCKTNRLGHQHICKECQKYNIKPANKTGKELIFTELFILGEQLKVHNVKNADMIRVHIEEIKEILRSDNE